jgi:hypothetical protein
MNFSEEIEGMDVLMTEDSTDFEGMDVSVSSDEAIKEQEVLAPDYLVDMEPVLTVGPSVEYAEDIVLLVDDKVPQEKKPTRLDNILTLSLVAALVLAILAVVFRKIRSDKKPQAVVVEEIPAAPAAEAPGSAGGVKLYDTDPKTAAMVMAIVADKLQKPLNELRFVSIKEVK